MLDRIDIQILSILQQNGRTKRSVIAEKVGLSLPSLSERIKKLEDHEIIQGYFTRVNRKAFNFDIMVIINVITESSKNFQVLSENVHSTPEILECYSVLGDSSHIMKAMVKDTEALEKLLGKIQSWPGVARTVTNFVLSAIKETNELPLK
ncbi:MAG: AsnC family transcriptional regulator [Melioribacteraceae bacterium]|nr:MAG: AsnC family transcriptional regulator [Melioribacteraceae bacterium]